MGFFASNYFGPQPSGGGGTYAAASDVRLSVNRGDGTLGTLVVPPRSYVDSSQTFDNGTAGESIMPPNDAILANVVAGIGAGLSGSTPGTVHLPSTSVVLAPNTFGPNNSLTGTATTTGGTIKTIINENRSVANNPR